MIPVTLVILINGAPLVLGTELILVEGASNGDPDELDDVPLMAGGRAVGTIGFGGVDRDDDDFRLHRYIKPLNMSHQPSKYGRQTCKAMTKYRTSNKHPILKLLANVVNRERK
jgi:hypothetical protein